MSSPLLTLTLTLTPRRTPCPCPLPPSPHSHPYHHPCRSPLLFILSLCSTDRRPPPRPPLRPRPPRLVRLSACCAWRASSMVGGSIYSPKCALSSQSGYTAILGSQSDDPCVNCSTGAPLCSPPSSLPGKSTKRLVTNSMLRNGENTKKPEKETMLNGTTARITKSACRYTLKRPLMWTHPRRYPGVKLGCWMGGADPRTAKGLCTPVLGVGDVMARRLALDRSKRTSEPQGWSHCSKGATM